MNIFNISFVFVDCSSNLLKCGYSISEIRIPDPSLIDLDQGLGVRGPGSVGPGPRARVCGRGSARVPRPGSPGAHAIVTSYEYTDL